MKFIIAGMVVLLVALSGAYYYFVWPPMALKHKTEHTLAVLNVAVDTQDRAKIANELKTLLAEQARIKLEIFFPSLPQHNAPPVVQDFDKGQFIAFVDNVLYALKTYSFDAKLREFYPGADRTTATIAFDSSAEVDDLINYSGLAAGVHFYADIACTGTADFYSGNAALDDVDCKVKLTLSAQQRLSK